ncbi:hypothetical protein CY96_28880 (plasmid) [Bacillus bombysepticus str. Wang]|uniref:Uncharacterized protein n=1 Tax=Bacillus bombysepticus str. Wang TaxID=1330043 RepID=A0A9W3PU59_9BACI|nr:hypothetical protein CY96_28880 [Bacillus bombysepticus str. Wang]
MVNNLRELIITKPKIPSDLLSSVTVDVVLAFQKLPIHHREMQISLESSSENYELKTEPLNFKYHRKNPLPHIIAKGDFLG